MTPETKSYYSTKAGARVYLVHVDRERKRASSRPEFARVRSELTAMQIQELEAQGAIVEPCGKFPHDCTYSTSPMKRGQKI